MAKSKPVKDEREEWLSFQLTPELVQRFNKYILAVANRKGRMPYAIKTGIGKMALEEWLDRNEKNLEIF
jgi:hypothetical protein